MKWLYITRARNLHSEHIVRTLYEHQALGLWYGGWPLLFKKEKWRILNNLILRKKFSEPWMDLALSHHFMYSHKAWELLRVAIARLKLGVRLEDYVWERGEFSLDRLGAKKIERHFDGVLGVEHGCLFSLRRAKEVGKQAALVFMSVHHSFREKWVDPEYARYPHWAASSESILLKLAPIRDRRRDEEAAVADVIFANSKLTKQSLVEAGVSETKVRAIPLGFPASKERTCKPETKVISSQTES